MVSPNNLRKDRWLASIVISDLSAAEADFIAAAFSMAASPP
jgi:hypothetical protein